MRAVREAERARRAYERSVAMEEKERKRLNLESRIAEVDAMNEELDTHVSRLETILEATLDVDDFLDFDSLKEEPELPPFQPGSLAVAEPPPLLERFLPSTPSAVGKLFPGAKAKHELAVESARAEFEKALASHAEREGERDGALAEARSSYERELAGIVARAEETNLEIDAFKQRFEEGTPEALIEYFSLVLEASNYPRGLPTGVSGCASSGVEAARR